MPTSPSDFEYEPIEQFCLDSNNILNNNNNPTRPPARIQRMNILTAKRAASISDMPMSISQALRHEYAEHFMAAFPDEINSLKDVKTFIEFFGKPSEIPKGSLLSSKAIFNIIFNPDGTFKKFKARLVARGDMLINNLSDDNYVGTVRADTLRLLLSLAAEHDMDLVSHDIKTAFLYSDLIKARRKYFFTSP